MNYLRLIVKYDSTPTPEERKTIETEIRTFLSGVAPDVHFEMMSGSGSFWILFEAFVAAASGWLLLQVASWTVKQGLDRLAQGVGSGRDSQDTFEAESPSAPEVWRSHRSTEAVHLLATLGVEMSALAKTMNARQVVFGEWSEDAGIGRIVSLKQDENGVALTAYQTDSRDDFDSRTTF